MRPPKVFLLCICCHFKASVAICGCLLRPPLSGNVINLRLNANYTIGTPLAVPEFFCSVAPWATLLGLVVVPGRPRGDATIF